MTTRKEILIKKYLEFQENLINTGFNSKVFPSLEDIDIVDLLLMFNLCFAYCSDYEPTIKALASSYGVSITDEELQNGMPHINEYINWLKEFQKN